MAVAVVIEQLAILFLTHVAGPDNFRSVDVGSVVDPLLQNFVVRMVSHQDQVLAALVLQLLQNARAPKIVEVAEYQVCTAVAGR